MTAGSIERHLTVRYGELFAAELDLLLYDLTSSYVEGAEPKSPIMRRGIAAIVGRSCANNEQRPSGRRCHTFSDSRFSSEPPNGVGSWYS